MLQDRHPRSIVPALDRDRSDEAPATPLARVELSSEAAAKPPLLGLSRAELRALLGDLVDRPYRVEQIYRALHLRGVPSFEAMTDLARPLREELARRFEIGTLCLRSRLPAGDGSEKFLFELSGGASIEAVDLPERERRTLCISSQAGCALACSFCVTGHWGAGRNLTSGEIVGQVLAIQRLRELEHERLNLVFMGMGEPLLNLEAVEAALAILTETLSWRRITVSTAGIVPGIDRMAKWSKRPNLAVSLHAPDDERRSRVMPINRSYPLAELLAALRRFPLEQGRKLTFEYILIRGFNDQSADADRLVRLIADLPAKVNLIPVNPDPVLGDGMVPPEDAVVESFRERLRHKGLVATVRRRRGDDVSAACGQLRAFARAPRGRRSQAAHPPPAR